jgi:hypothetical protein
LTECQSTNPEFTGSIPSSFTILKVDEVWNRVPLHPHKDNGYLLDFEVADLIKKIDTNRFDRV